MKKITFAQVCQTFQSYNDARNVSQFRDKKSLKAVIVFKQGPWFKQEYTEEQRSYIFSSDNKYFISGLGGCSLYADCLDGSDRGVRLDWYLPEWKIDYCYMVE